MPPSISGYLMPGSDDVPIANRHIVLCERLSQEEKNLTCKLMDTYSTSNDDGYFEFWDIPTGAYFLFYDSGWLDFEAGLEQWGGKTIEVGNVEWLVDNYCTKESNGDLTFMLPAGAKLSFGLGSNINIPFLMVYRFFVKSPFFWAHECGPEECGNPEDINPVQANVGDSLSEQITFTVFYHSQEEE